MSRSHVPVSVLATIPRSDRHPITFISLLYPFTTCTLEVLESFTSESKPEAKWVRTTGASDRYVGPLQPSGYGCHHWVSGVSGHDQSYTDWHHSYPDGLRLLGRVEVHLLVCGRVPTCTPLNSSFGEHLAIPEGGKTPSGFGQLSVKQERLITFLPCTKHQRLN